MQADLSGAAEGGGERRPSKQASMPSCQRTPNERSVDLHTFDKKREGGRRGRDPVTQQLKSQGTGGEEERGVLGRGRGLASAVVKCNAAGGGGDAGA